MFVFRIKMKCPLRLPTKRKLIPPDVWSCDMPTNVVLLLGISKKNRWISKYLNYVDKILWKVISRTDIKVKMQKLFYGKCLHNNPMKMSTHFSAALCWQADPGIFQKSVGEIWRQKSNFSKKVLAHKLAICCATYN